MIVVLTIWRIYNTTIHVLLKNFGILIFIGHAFGCFINYLIVHSTFN